jgi:lysophospholipase L1-like esterase
MGGLITRRRAARAQGTERAATTTEYALVLAGIAGAVTLALGILSPAVQALFARAVCAIGGSCAATAAPAHRVDPWDDPDPVRRATWGDVVVLGDSFSSGEGAGDYGAAGSARDCHASANSYGPRLARRLGVDARHLSIRACTGATVADLAHRYDDHDQPPQLDGLDGRTSLVALTIGGNDLRWSDTIANCIAQTAWDGHADCVAGTDRARQLDRKLGALDRSLTRALTSIRRRAPHARVVLMGYPRFFPERPDRYLTWGGVAALAPETQRWANAETGELNDHMARAASAAGVEFVDARDAFDHHELTSTHPWFHGIEVTAEPMQVGIYTVPKPEVLASSFHPTAEGQRVLADLMEDAVRFPGLQG